MTDKDVRRNTDSDIGVLAKQPGSNPIANPGTPMMPTGDPAVGKPGPPRGKRGRFSPYLLLIPAAAVIVFALGYALVQQFIMAFQDYGMAQQFGQPAPFVGLKNFQELVTSQQMWAVILRSIAFCLVNAALTMAIGSVFAVLMTKIPKSVRLLFQIAMLLAWSMPLVAAMTVWQWMFDANRGVVNYVLGNIFGIDSMIGHNWLQQPLSFFTVATVVIVWASVPFVAFTIYAGLIGVPEDTLEAAEIDGAGAWQRFWRIIVPMVKPVLLMVGLLQIIWDLRVFAQINMLQTTGGLKSQTDLIGTYIYGLGLGSHKFGLAAAASIFILVLTIGLSAYYVKILLREEDSV